MRQREVKQQRAGKPGGSRKKSDTYEERQMLREELRCSGDFALMLLLSPGSPGV